MCGRYQFTAEQCAEILQIIQDVERRHGAGAWTPGEIRPTAVAPVLVSSEKGIHSELQSWGYKMPGNLVINARAETAADKPMFRASVASQRCVIPSTGFFEWDSQKRKYLFQLPGEDMLYMAGLYSIRDGKPCYCILTTSANDSMKDIHHRMPLVLKREQVAPWLEQPKAAGDYLRMTPPLLKKTDVEPQLRLW
ncbi:MAG: SOS response-associated peptidase [Oscillibacter sp.]|nr:SOS response-associated peptidase [Oscillibacter sp.]